MRFFEKLVVAYFFGPPCMSVHAIAYRSTLDTLVWAYALKRRSNKIFVFWKIVLIGLVAL